MLDAEPEISHGDRSAEDLTEAFSSDDLEATADSSVCHFRRSVVMGRLGEESLPRSFEVIVRKLRLGSRD